MKKEYIMPKWAAKLYDKNTRTNYLIRHSHNLLVKHLEEVMKNLPINATIVDVGTGRIKILAKLGHLELHTTAAGSITRMAMNFFWN